MICTDILKLPSNAIASHLSTSVGKNSLVRYDRHTGESPTLPIPPTSKQVTLRGCTVVHISGGKVIEEFEYTVGVPNLESF